MDVEEAANWHYEKAREFFGLYKRTNNDFNKVLYTAKYRLHLVTARNLRALVALQSNKAHVSE